MVPVVCTTITRAQTTSNSIIIVAACMLCRCTVVCMRRNTTRLMYHVSSMSAAENVYCVDCGDVAPYPRAEITINRYSIRLLDTRYSILDTVLDTRYSIHHHKKQMRARREPLASLPKSALQRNVRSSAAFLQKLGALRPSKGTSRQPHAARRCPPQTTKQTAATWVSSQQRVVVG